MIPKSHQAPVPKTFTNGMAQKNKFFVIFLVSGVCATNILVQGSQTSQDLLPKHCGTFSTDRIWNGKEAAPDEHPWAVMIEHRSRFSNGVRQFGCGGSLITNRYVLTAAHCLRNRRLRVIGVVLGVTDTETELNCDGKNCTHIQHRAVSKQIVHENYNNNTEYGYDIALLRLKIPAVFMENVKPICLPEAGFSTADLSDGKGTIAGWGRTETKDRSSKKLVVTVPLVNRSACRKLLPYYTILDSEICAGGDGKDSCIGDSGNTLSQQDEYNKWFALGIVSYGGVECGKLNTPAIYTDVPYFREWILKNIRP